MLDKHIALVKGQIAHYEDLLDRFQPGHPKYNPSHVRMYERILKEHDDLLAYLIEQKNHGPNASTALVDPSLPEKPESASPIPDHLADLPPELLAQLSDRVKKGQNDPLVQIIQDRGGTATLDEILIDLYRRHKEIGTRNIVSNKLYRLSKQGFVRSVDGRKGVYSIAV